MHYWPLIRLLPRETHFKFVSFAPIAAVLSGIAVLASVASLVVFGLNLGVGHPGAAVPRDGRGHIHVPARRR